MSILDESETSVREKVIAYAKARGWKVIVVDYAGWPDRLFVGPSGQHVWMEFKRPKGGRHYLRQKARLAILQGMQCNAHLVRTTEQGTGIINAWYREKTDVHQNE